MMVPGSAIASTAAIGALLLVAATILVAGYIPARRAARVDAVRVLAE
jgi:ABC-type antimicrobial peptide transport system permease subunit